MKRQLPVYSRVYVNMHEVIALDSYRVYMFCAFTANGLPLITSMSHVRGFPAVYGHHLVERAVGHIDKKLSCRREAARCFVSLNILLSHLKAFEMIPFIQ